jgi:hypothetical protein
MPARKYRLLVENPDVLPAEDVNSIRVRVRAQSNVTLATPGATIDGVSMVAGQEFWTDVQSTGSQDGAYVWNGASTPATRSLKLPAGAKAADMLVVVAEGTDADRAFLVTNNPGSDVVGTDGLVTAGFVTSGGTTSPGTSHTHAWTGTPPTAAEVDLVTGTGFSTSGQVVTSTESMTVDLNQYAGCWLLAAAQPPCLIVSHPAVAAAPVAFTVYGAAPTTDAGTYKILRAPTPGGGSSGESSHTHTF